MKHRLSAFYFLFFLAAGSSGPFVTLLLHTRGISTPNIGLILAAGALTASVLQPVIGHLDDRWGRSRSLLFFAALTSPLIFWGYTLARGLIEFIAVAVAINLVQGAFPVADALAVTESRSHDFSYGQVRLWGAAGYAIMVAAAGWLYHQYGYEVAVYVYAAMTAPLLIVIARFPKHDPSMRKLAHAGARASDLLREKKLMAFIAISFFVTIALTINASFLPLYYAALHYPLAWVGLNFTVAAAVEIPCFFWSGRLMARLGRLNTVILATAIFASKYFILSLAPGALIVIAAQTLDGVAYALFWSASVEVVSQLAPGGRASSAQTLYAALAGSLSGILATALGGWLLGSFGPRVLYLAMAISTMLMIAPFRILARSVSFSDRVGDTSQR